MSEAAEDKLESDPDNMVYVDGEKPEVGMDRLPQILSLWSGQRARRGEENETGFSAYQEMHRVVTDFVENKVTDRLCALNSLYSTNAFSDVQDNLSNRNDMKSGLVDERYYEVNSYVDGMINSMGSIVRIFVRDILALRITANCKMSMLAREIANEQSPASDKVRTDKSVRDALGALLLLLEKCEDYCQDTFKEWNKYHSSRADAVQEYVKKRTPDKLGMIADLDDEMVMSIQSCCRQLTDFYTVLEATV